VAQRGAINGKMIQSSAFHLESVSFDFFLMVLNDLPLRTAEPIGPSLEKKMY